MSTSVKQIAEELSRLAGQFEDRALNPTSDDNASAWSGAASDLRDYVRSLPVTGGRK